MQMPALRSCATTVLASLSLLMGTLATAAAQQWVVYKGTEGPGLGKQIVLISGDEEYRSEESLPQLGKILAKHHGFTCTVLFAINPETGFIDPNYTQNIPGLEALASADLMIIATRFRDLPDEQMQAIDDYLRSGRPVLGLRTATHAFNIEKEKPWAHYGNNYEGDLAQWHDGFGRLIFGEHWISHHGKHKDESTRGFLAPGAQDNPILRGIKDGDIWGPTDVYGVRLPLPGDSQPLVLGQVVERAGERDDSDPLYGMRPTDLEPVEGKNDPMMPIAWTRTWQLPDGERGRAFMTTMGSSTDLLNAPLRRLIVNAVYSLLGMEDQNPRRGDDGGDCRRLPADGIRISQGGLLARAEDAGLGARVITVRRRVPCPHRPAVRAYLFRRGTTTADRGEKFLTDWCQFAT